MKHYWIAVLCVCPLLAQADIYKSVDENGHVTYSSTPTKGSKKLYLEPLPTMKPPTIPSAGFPKVDGETQKARDDTRRKILRDELDTEQKLLDEAQKNLDEVSPGVYKGSDGKTYRNVEKYNETVKQLQEQVDLHKKNIEALNTELSKISK